MKSTDDLQVGLQEVEQEIKYLVDNYDTLIIERFGKYDFGLERGRINTLLRFNGDKRKDVISAIDYINEDKERLEFALKNLDLI